MTDRTSAPRRCTTRDLAEVNRVIGSGIDGWDLSERVKRLSLPLYQYQPEDLDHLHLIVIEAGNRVVAVAAWEPAPQEQVPAGQQGLLLHVQRGSTVCWSGRSRTRPVSLMPAVCRSYRWSSSSATTSIATGCPPTGNRPSVLPPRDLKQVVAELGTDRPLNSVYGCREYDLVEFTHHLSGSETTKLPPVPAGWTTRMLASKCGKVAAVLDFLLDFQTLRF